MRRALNAFDHLPLHGLGPSRDWEAQALARTPAHELMARAGAAVAKLALAVQPHARRIAVLCGPGNNGGDGLVAARLLQAAGKQVQLLLCSGEHPTPADAAWAWREAQAAGLAPMAWPAALQADLVIDALLGLGGRRAPEGQIGAAIGLINSQATPVLAIDLPSGLDGQRGQATLAVRARHTLALMTLKPGLFTAQGRALAGEIWWDELGPSCTQPAQAWLLGQRAPSDWLALTGPRGHASHKGSWGDVLVLGGAPGLRGAAQLAAQAALAAGAGRIYVCSLGGEAEAPLARPELMSWPESRLQQPDGWRRHTLVAGCGGGALVGPCLPALLPQARRLVLDADGLNALAADAQLRALLRARQAQGRATVLTPHPLEAARLLGSSSAEVQADRLGAAQTLALDLRCTVVLKGSGTVIASPGQTSAINSSGNARLASAGTGDVLAGWIGGLWAQYGGDDPAATHTLACAAVYWHGAAAAGGGGPLRAAELIERMQALHAPIEG